MVVCPRATLLAHLLWQKIMSVISNLRDKGQMLLIQHHVDGKSNGNVWETALPSFIMKVYDTLVVCLVIVETQLD